MQAYVRYVIYNARSSFWFVPFLLLVSAVAFAEAATWLERSFGEEIVRSLPWIVSLNAEGARSLVSTIAASIITVTSLVFSLTLVALTVASSQLGPRLLVMFMRDRFVQFVLGSFVATFVFALLVFRSIRTIGDEIFVPHLSVNITLILAIMTFGLLIAFIHHVATAIQADTVIAKVRTDLDKSLESLLPRADSGSKPEPDVRMPGGFSKSATSVPAAQSGYIQTIEYGALLDLAITSDTVLRVERRPGHFVLQDECIASIVSPPGREEFMREKVQAAVVVGEKRTMAQDIEFAFSSLVEIALRALSAGINDPHTAIACIDQLTAGLALAIDRMPAKTVLYDEEENVRVQLDAVTFEGLVDASFNEIRQNCGSNLNALIRLSEALSSLALLVRDEEQISVIRKHRDMIDRTGRSTIQEENDRVDFAGRIEELDRRLKERRRTLGIGRRDERVQ